MPDYSGIINTIETAVYGRDMRQAIANGFRLCQSNEGGGGGSVTVDTTLTVSGQAADSKTVGDKFTDLESQISAISPGLSRAEKDAILAYFAEQVEIHPSLEDAYQTIYNLWNKPVNSITLNKHSLMLAVGMSEKLLVTIDPPDAYDRTVTWRSSPQGFVSVAHDGTVMALQDGRATVTASCGGKTDSCSVTAVQMNYYSVTNNLTNVTNSNSASSVLEGESYSATLSVLSDYNFADVQITMGGTNITSSAYNDESHEIYIASVTGNITITASATKIVYYSVMWQLSNVSVSGGDQPSTVLGGSTFNYTIQANSDANYEINSIQVMMGDNDITSTAVTAGGEGEKSVTITIASVSGNIKIIVSAVVAIKALNDCTWDEISQISSSGQAANTFSVGDQKTITFTGNGSFGDGMRLTGNIDVFILGINHNASYEGNNLIHFCMGKSDGQLAVLYNAVQGSDKFADGTNNDTNSAVLGCYDTYVSSSERGSNRYGFGLSGMAYLCGKYVSNIQTSRVGVIGSLPTDLRAVMKKATKYYDTERAIASIDLPMSIPSVYELSGVHYSGTETWSDQNQQQYEYFKSGNSYSAKGLSFNSSGNQGVVGSYGGSTYWLRNRVSSSRDTTERNYFAMNGRGSLETLYDGTFNFACMFLFFV